MKTPIILWLNEPTPCRKWEPIAFLVLTLILAAVSIAIITCQQSQIAILHESSWAWHQEANAK